MRPSSRKLFRRTEGPEDHSVPSGIPRQAVIQAHQEQLDEMAELGFKEETLMSQLVPNVSGLGRTCRGCWELASSKFDGRPYLLWLHVG